MTHPGGKAPPGALVASQDPAPGARVKKGTVVSVRFSVGVPNLIGMSHTRAHQVMAAAGLRLSHPGPEDPPADAAVDSQNPAGGSRLAIGEVGLHRSDTANQIRPAADALSRIQILADNPVATQDFGGGGRVEHPQACLLN